MTGNSDITGLILAGGAGRRVGRRDKGLIEWQGKPLIDHVYQRLAPQVGAVIISCNRNLVRYQQYAETIIIDKRDDYQGPLAGIEAAADLIHSKLLAVVACDAPELPADLVARLSEPFNCARDTIPDACYAHDGDREQYLCAVLRHECLPALTDFLDSGQRAVRDWYQSMNTCTVDFSDQKLSFQNYNKLD